MPPRTIPTNAIPIPTKLSIPTPKSLLHDADAALDVWLEAALVPEADDPMGVVDARELMTEDKLLMADE